MDKAVNNFNTDFKYIMNPNFSKNKTDLVRLTIKKLYSVYLYQASPTTYSSAKMVNTVYCQNSESFQPTYNKPLMSAERR